jgi:hypothetical protein
VNDPPQVFVAQLDAGGQHVWSRQLGVELPEGTEQEIDVGLQGAGHPVVVANFGGTIDIGQGPITAAAYSSVLVAELDPSSGDTLWAVGAGGTVPQTAIAMATDGSSVIVTGATEVHQPYLFGADLLLTKLTH